MRCFWAPLIVKKNFKTVLVPDNNGIFDVLKNWPKVSLIFYIRETSIRELLKMIKTPQIRFTNKL